MSHVPLFLFQGQREQSGYPRVLKDGQPFVSPWMAGVKHGHPYHWEWCGQFPVQGQLALAILLEVCSTRLAIALHQQFAWEILQNLDRDRWSMSSVGVLSWVAELARKAESPD
jgi:hypothetical protein